VTTLRKPLSWFPAPLPLGLPQMQSKIWAVSNHNCAGEKLLYKVSAKASNCVKNVTVALRHMVDCPYTFMDAVGPPQMCLSA
jgi:hypothetical protein